MIRSTSDLFTIDGKGYNLLVEKLERTGEVTDTEASGRTGDYTMHRDIIGTFYNYKVTCRTVDYSEDALKSYDEFFQTITAPVPSHDVSFPYGQETLEFKAYVTKAVDTLIRMDDKNIWGYEGVQVSFIAMAPQRRRI